MRSFFYLALLGVILITAALVTRSGLLWRKNSGRPINTAMREALNKEYPQYSVDDEQTIGKLFGTAHKLPSGLRYVVRAPGTGTVTPTVGEELIVHYEGRLLDGTAFDSSYRKGVPFVFRVGTGAVIRGWDEAFMSMKKGEKRTLIIPHWLAYGDKGRRPTIPPKATLIFEVELLDWR
ncbi:FKBP-type peptidyl-prolyl cis-trans isomerase [Horticoccus sp. 23ND18S-11]|uniref:FKBP-type peptidyl-prolyl cis-trans isomerase n=1 Tax=Horticoccus sp. 23ND18S-11 TaxID=3391832 RepID=UPI0039C921E6